MQRVINFIGSLLILCFTVLIAYFLFQWLRYDIIKKEEIQLFTNRGLFLFIATSGFVVTAGVCGYAAFLMMSEFKLKGIIIFAILILFLAALIFMYRVLI